ncbi:MAG TPA: group III truncated hemoglobin [Xanthobacteraceae bacterium]|nr:group III truncated hemoglobin [Xanthobacteraceae bacterium]
MDIPVQTAAPSPLDGARLLSVNEDTIHALVHGFYDTVLKDPVIGPIFSREVAPDHWPVHLDKMCAFWSSLLLKTRRYQGHPLRPHLRINELSDEHFQRWLSLFRATTLKVFDKEDADAVYGLAARIAQSFRLAVAFHRGEDTTKLTPLAARIPQ